MSFLYVTEYEREYNGLPVQPPLAEQKITISGTTAQSAAFNALTKVVRLHVDALTGVTFGVSPTAATASSARMVAGQTELFYASGGLKVAGITVT
jgi:hypothetical protein